MPHLQPIVRALDETIRATIPGLTYAVKWKRPYYGLPGLGWIIELAAYHVSVNVVFLGGADFDPPPPLGTTERTRYIKVTSLEEAQRPELHRWIEEAGRTLGWTRRPCSRGSFRNTGPDGGRLSLFYWTATSRRRVGAVD
jgi:hypothetical protein